VVDADDNATWLLFNARGTLLEVRIPMVSKPQCKRDDNVRGARR
jgi:hypothetical protein